MAMLPMSAVIMLATVMWHGHLISLLVAFDAGRLPMLRFRVPVALLMLGRVAPMVVIVGGGVISGSGAGIPPLGSATAQLGTSGLKCCLHRPVS
jgi:hypothetical protein